MGEKEEEKKEYIRLDRERYESLLIELGELRKVSEFMDECKNALHDKELELKQKDRELEEIKEILLETEWKDYELEQTMKRLRELEAEIERMKKSGPWWKRLLGRIR